MLEKNVIYHSHIHDTIFLLNVLQGIALEMPHEISVCKIRIEGRGYQNRVTLVLKLHLNFPKVKVTAKNDVKVPEETIPKGTGSTLMSVWLWNFKDGGS